MTPRFAAMTFMLAALVALPALAQSSDPASPPPSRTETKGEAKEDAVDPVARTATNIVERPLKDLNIVKAKIPPGLAAISTRPYATTGLKSCRHYAAAINAMTVILGPDVDSPAVEAKGNKPAEFVLDSTESLIGDLLPGGGIIRKLTGAEAAQKRLVAAVYAGGLRRAYLKGAARAKGCKV